LIVFRKYQIPPRFLKAIAHPLAHPAIKSLTIESNDPTAPNEWNLTTTDAVIDRMSAHAEVLSRGVHVEPTWLDDRPRNDVRFHGGTPSGAEGVVGRGDRLPPLAGADRIVGAALGISGSCDSHGVVAVATSRSARSSGLTRGSLAADERVNCAG
jgi:hypothetical protein